MRRLACTVALLATLVPALTSPGSAAPANQGAGRLEEPLLWANMCGAGDPHDVHFTIAATGDTFPHENIQAVGEANGYDSLFDYLRPFLLASDVAYTNLDGALLEGSPYTGYPAFNFNPHLATALRGAGIALVSTANNHILDRGPAGLDATLGVLAQNGIAQHGAVTVAEAQSGAPRPPYLTLVLTRDGVSITVGFISATWGTNGIPDPHNQVNLLWQANSYGSQGGVRQSVLDAVAQASRETDLVVVAAHWGAEYQFYPQPYQVEGAQRLAEAGADIILGAQSHTLQPVDVIDAGGRRTLVIYSLANFLASQGAFQNPYYSATSVVFYAGVVREADGTVRVTGYRYLPTIHVDGDTRPAPIPPQGYEAVIAHVRMIMRDVDGVRQVSHDPALLGGRVEICPTIGFAEVPEVRLGGDFAQHYITLGSGVSPREPRETIAVLGLPLGMPARAATGDCASETTVLYTERQRLELDVSAAWPYRVIGTQLGAEAFRRRYGATPEPRVDEVGNPLTDERFRAFYQRYGGLPVFGYPISAALEEAQAESAGSSELATVQYFERARLELVRDPAAGADLLSTVRVAPLGRHALAEQWVCAPAGMSGQRPGTNDQMREAGDVASGAGAALPASAPLRDEGSALEIAVPGAGLSIWLWPVLLVAGLVSSGVLAVWWYRGGRGQDRGAHHGRRRARPAAWSSWRAEQPETDEELLRRLMSD